jgi:glycosyltransferase involved in cell wall biosynthesis
MVNKKVCMLVFNEFRPDMRVYNEALMLKEHGGFDVKIMALKKSEDVPASENMRGGIEVQRIPVRERELHLNFFSPIYHTKTMPDLYQHARSAKADIYHCHDLYTLPLGVKLKQADGVPVIYDAHEPDYGAFMAAKPLPGMPPAIRRAAANIYERSSAGKIDRMLVTTEFARQAKKGQGYSLPIDVIPYRANPEYFSPSLTLKELEEKFRSKRVIIFIGNIGETKGFYQMLDAFKTVKAEINNAHLLIVGEVQAWLEHAEKIESMGLSGSVEVTKYLPYWEVAPYINIAEVGLMLSREDMENYRLTLPNKIMDYMACGKPFVASRLPQVEKIVEEHQCGLLVDSRNPDQIAGAVLEILQNQSRSERMGARGLKAVAGPYSWNGIRDRLIGIYEKLL